MMIIMRGGRGTTAMKFTVWIHNYFLWLPLHSTVNELENVVNDDDSWNKNLIAQKFKKRQRINSHLFSQLTVNHIRKNNLILGISKSSRLDLESWKTVRQWSPPRNLQQNHIIEHLIIATIIIVIIILKANNRTRRRRRWQEKDSSGRLTDQSIPLDQSPIADCLSGDCLVVIGRD